MSYPSFIYAGIAGDSTENRKQIPENVLSDLTISGDIKAKTADILRIPCTAAEILQRQGIFRLCLDNEALISKLTELKEMLTDLIRVAGYYEKAENRNSSVMLFLPVILKYTEAVRRFSELKEFDGRIGEIGECFNTLQGSAEFISAENDFRYLMKNRHPEMLFSLHGIDGTASEGHELIVERLEKYFREMGLEDAVPPRKNAIRLDNQVIDSYAKVYKGFFASAEMLEAKYKALFLSGEYDLQQTFAYTDELSFILEITSYYKKLRDFGYPLTYPEISEKHEFILDGVVDASLIKRELHGNEVVPNDLYMSEEYNGEKLSFYIVTGANGGGKTTFVRACGISLLFFLAGCPITAASGRIYPFNAIYTHFPDNESFESNGRFVNEANRAEEIISSADNDSFTLFNETYSGTDEKKSEDYSRRLADIMYDRGVFGMFVTHIHSLTGGNVPTLSAVIDESNENRRTYKIKRVGATSSSFAKDILEKYGLDRVSLEKKLLAGGRNVN